MPLDAAYAAAVQGWKDGLAAAKTPHLGPKLVVEVPVDKTSKIGVAFPLLLLYVLGGSQDTLKDEPADVKSLTIWKPPGTATTPVANRRTPLKSARVVAYRRSEYNHYFIKAPLDPGHWLKYTPKTKPKTLRYISVKAPPIVGINSMLYVLAHYFTKQPAALKTHNSMFVIPDKETFTLDNLGELTAGKSKAASQETGEIPASAPAGNPGAKQSTKS